MAHVLQKHPLNFRSQQRSGSLIKVLDATSLDLASQSLVENRKDIPFHNFRFTASIPKGTSHIKPKIPTSINHSHTLKEITGSLPKLATKGLTHNNQFSVTLSPTGSKNNRGLGGVSKMPNFDSFSSHIKSIENNRSQYASVAQTTDINIQENLSFNDLRARYPSDHATAAGDSVDQIFFREETEGEQTPSKKTMGAVRLPLKRRALNKDMRDAYRAVIESKEHGNFSELAPREDREAFMSSIQKVKERGNVSFYGRRDGDQKNGDQEEERAMDEINKKGLKDFHRKIALYNFMKGNYLVEPERKEDLRADLGLKKMLISKMKRPTDLYKDFSTASEIAIKQTQNLSFGTLKPGKEILRNKHTKQRGDLTAESKRTKDQEALDCSMDEEDQETQAHKKIRLPPATAVSQRTNAIEQDLKKMKELGGFIPAKKKLSNEEQILFKLVKEGNDSDLGYQLSRNSDCLNAMDGRNETLLHWAVKRGYYNCVIVLCRFGANIDVKDMANRKPIDIAVRLGNLEISEYLQAQHRKKEAALRYS